MKRALIFCAGELNTPVPPPQSSDLIIAADGGLEHLQPLGLEPDIILGDFDSLGYIPQNAAVYPVEKDDTDAMLAARRGLELGCDRFLFYGALEGPRMDHAVANFQTLQFLADRGARGILVGRDTWVTVLKNGTLTLPPLEDGIVSVFCMGPDAHRVTIRGLKYELDNGTLTAGFPLGVSNHMVGHPVEITVEQGSLLIFYPGKAGIPYE